MAKSKSPTAASPDLPTVGGWPLLGALPTLFLRGAEFLTDSHDAYGDVFSLDLGASQMIVTRDPDHAMYVLRSHETNFVEPEVVWAEGGPSSLRPPEARGDSAEVQRLAAMTPAVSKAVTSELEAWTPTVTAGRPVDIAQLLAAASLRALRGLMPGSSLADTDIQALSRLIPLVSGRHLSRWLTEQLPWWIPAPSRLLRRRSARRANAIALAAVSERLQQGASDGEDLLSLLVHASGQPAAGPSALDALMRTVVPVLRAFLDTSVVGLSRAVVLLGEQPEALQRALHCVDDVLGPRTPTAEDLEPLLYLRWVTQEALRLHSPVTWITREAIEDDKMGALSVTAGQRVGIFVEGVHHHPAIWSHPERFRPERFDQEDTRSRHPFAWVPCGSGSVADVVQPLTLLMGQVFLALLLQRFTVVTSRSANTPRRVSLRPRG